MESRGKREREREREYLRDLLRDLLKMSRVLKAESLLRLLCLVLASLFAVLVGFDTQTETVFFVRRKATVKDLEVLWISTIIASVAAGYHLLQLCRCLAFVWLARTPSWGNKSAAWASFLLDQVLMADCLTSAFDFDYDDDNDFDEDDDIDSNDDDDDDDMDDYDDDDMDDDDDDDDGCSDGCDDGVDGTASSTRSSNKRKEGAFPIYLPL